MEKYCYTCMTVEEVNTVSAKGGIVIPAKLRKKYNIKPGDKVVWMPNERGELVLKRYKSTEIKYEDL